MGDHKTQGDCFSFLKRSTSQTPVEVLSAIVVHTEGCKLLIAQYHISIDFGYPEASQMARGDCL